MSRLKLEIVTPEQPIVVAEVDEVIIPGANGEFGVLPEHTTFLTQLGEGALTYRQGTGHKKLTISGGFCEVRQNHVTVLADVAKALQ